MPQVKVIQPIAEQAKKLRVAAYARVSSDSADQLNSFATQVDYYTSTIQAADEWEFAGLYADEGVTGTRADKREDFQRLLQDCRAGKIDCILVKSISRFARNTLECIQTVRELKQLGVTVVFEKEGIDTGSMGSEMLLSILGAAAQEESLSISQNLKWSYRRRMKSGDFITSKALLGYFFANNTLVPDPQEVPIVEYIFNSYLAGKGIKEIASELNQAELKATNKMSDRWHPSMIRYILSNEKYIGDSLVQKTYIIPREMYLQIQEELARRNSKKPANAKKSKTNRGRFTSKYALSERLVCGECGSYFRRVTWNIHGRKEIVWRCINRLEFGPKACGKSPSLVEESLHRAILAAIRSLVDGRQEEMAESLRETLVDCLTGETNGESPQALQGRIEELEQEFDRLLPMAAEENEVIDRKLKQINDELLQLKQRKKRAEHSYEWAEAQEAKAKEVMAMVSAEDLDLSEYSDVLVYRIVERVTVLSKEEIRIRFIGGLEISQHLT